MAHSTFCATVLSHAAIVALVEKWYSRLDTLTLLMVTPRLPVLPYALFRDLVYYPKTTRQMRALRISMNTDDTIVWVTWRSDTIINYTQYSGRVIAVKKHTMRT